MYRVSLAADMPVGPNRGLIAFTFVVIGTVIESKFVSYHNRAYRVVMNM